jgi:hypothetical protein
MPLEGTNDGLLGTTKTHSPAPSTRNNRSEDPNYNFAAEPQQVFPRYTYLDISRAGLRLATDKISARLVVAVRLATDRPQPC